MPAVNVAKRERRSENCFRGPVFLNVTRSPSTGIRISCVLVGLVVVMIASACGGRSSHRWVSCARPPGSAADVRDFKVNGGETCSHASRILGYTAFGHEGGCGDACHYLGYTCRERPGGLKRSSGGGSFYTYVDDWCVRGSRHAAWRIIFH